MAGIVGCDPGALSLVDSIRDTGSDQESYCILAAMACGLPVVRPGPAVRASASLSRPERHARRVTPVRSHHIRRAPATAAHGGRERQAADAEASLSCESTMNFYGRRARGVGLA